ncbi:MAG TPA: glycoside hydrolase family 99-like domain-containing protein, partial [Terricaulis sp.]|nr:glycoside hydrolase family 99-like domain-containing protein [Terricaulis sp.]
YKLFRGVTPAWDNTARRPHDSAVLVNTSPSAFQAWLANAARDTAERFANPDERLVFINAWNEWAEGAHLEPDKRHGYAWLEAARRALDPSAERPRVLVVTHDLARHGAQYLALDIARRLRTQLGCDVACISGEHGPLAEAYKAEGPLHVLDSRQQTLAAIEDEIKSLAAQGYRHAIVNSAASAWIGPLLARHGIEHIGLVHELAGVLRQRGLIEPLKALNESARALIFPAEIVRDQAREACALPAWRNAVLRPQGLYAASTLADLSEKEHARKRLAARLNLPEETRFVLGVGYADHRKGIDIFFTWAKAAAKRWPDLHFIWVGDTPPKETKALEQQYAQARRDGARLHMLPFTQDLADFYAGAAFFALSSREDPFPSVALEAFAQATPVLMIDGAGGIQDFAQDGCVAVTAQTPNAFIQAAARWLDHPAALRSAGLAGRELMRARFGATSYVAALTDLLGLNRPNISVIVPNYNYARHLEQRLSSILAQTLSPQEIIVLDDASTDDSIAVAERVLSQASINWRIVRNEKNSGSAFAQWRKGAERASGDLLWIAEADDWADPHFLEAAAKPFQRPGVVLSMTQSKQANSAGAVIAPDYLDYVRDVSPDKWTRAFTAPGAEEVRDGLSIKNTIPNVSAVLFSRPALAGVMARHAQEISAYRVAGDWCVYANLLREGAIAFNPTALNYHRRHDDSVTISRFGLAELAEIARMQAYVARHFGVSAEQERQARAYLEKLVTQFGLDGRCSAAQIEGAMRGIVAA